MTRPSNGTVPRLVLLGVAAACLGWLLRGVPEQTPGQRWWPWLLFGGLAEVAGRGRRSARTDGRVRPGKIARWAQRSERNDGVATAWELWRVSGRHAVRKQAKQLRPSAAELGFLARLRVRTLEYATPLARVGRQRIWSPIEDVTIRIGGPRTGKSGELGCRILDAPGAVIATSTRTDLLEKTGPLRSRRGPVYVFNPSGVGKRASTITFDPLSGCADPKTAAERADGPAVRVARRPAGAGSGTSGRTRPAASWRACCTPPRSARRRMRDVQSWVADPDEAAVDIRRFLRRSQRSRRSRTRRVQFLGNNERTRTSICTTIMPALGWLARRHRGRGRDRRRVRRRGPPRPPRHRVHARRRGRPGRAARRRADRAHRPRGPPHRRRVARAGASTRR